jgi:chitinase
MLRKDPGARVDEYMVDDAGCNGAGEHKLCCPPNMKTLSCGWYTHNNGRCEGSCPIGMTEIGSNSKHCQMIWGMTGYQAACCTTSTENMKLYSQCSWSPNFPHCYESTCSNDIVLYSSTGSGDARCINLLSGDDNRKRKYCCNNGDKNSQ